MRNDFYVYEHYRPDTGLCFYVGKGQKNRARRTDGRNSYWKRIVNKLKDNGLSYEIKIIVENLTNEEATETEIATIACWKEAGVSLSNMTEGGEGALGRCPSEETRQKMAAAARRTCNSRGHVPTEETKRKMSEAWNKISDRVRENMRKAWERRRLVGISEETKEKTRESMKHVWANKSPEERDKIRKNISAGRRRGALINKKAAA